MIQIRRSSERGHLNFGWLDTYHTFSFGEYWDRKWMGFSHLRVINEDRVAPSEGFGTHPHRDMEIITYVISGALQHRDSMGNGSVIHAGEVQRMSAGTGITHSEFNASDTEECHLLQIWLLPERNGITPDYEERAISREAKLRQFCPIATPDRRDGSFIIHQNASVYTSILPAGESLNYEAEQGRSFWIQVVSGKLLVEGELLEAGDGVGITEMQNLKMKALEEAEFLLFDMG